MYRLLFARLFVFVAFYLEAVLSFSQSVGLQFFDSDNGLPSSEVYRVFEDKLGRLWFCTDRGIAFYDSYKIQKVPSNSGEQVFIDGYCDENGVCWFKSLKNNLYKYSKSGLIFHEDSKGIKALDNFFMDDSTIFYTSHKAILEPYPICLLRRTAGITDTIEKSNFDVAIHDIKSLRFEVYYSKECNRAIYSLFGTNKSLNDTVVYHNGSLTVQVTVPMVKVGSGMNNGAFGLGNGKLLLNCNGVFYLIDVKNKKSKKLLTMDYVWGTINSAFIHKSYLYFSSTFRYVRRISLIDNSVEELTFNKNKVISSIVFDREDNLWASTLEKGVIFMPNIQSSNLLGELNITAVKKTKNSLLLGTKAGELIVFNPASNKSYQIASSKSDLKTVDILEEKYAIVQGQRFDINKSGLNNCRNNWINYLFEVNGRFYAISTYALIEVWPESGAYEPIKRFDSKLYTAMRIGNKILISTDNQLLEFSLDTKSHKVLLNTNYRVTSIKVFGKYYILTTLGEGIFIFDYNKNQLIKQITTLNGLASNTTYFSLSSDDRTAWIASNNGLTRILFGENGAIENIVYFDKSNGLPSNEINCLSYDDGKLYIGTTKGLGIINIKNLKIPNYKPKVSINYFNVISDTTNSGALKSEFKYNENNIKISFSAFIVSKTLTKPTYLYALLMDNPSDTQWIATDETTLQFTNLDPGDYVFVVKAQARFGGFGPITAYNFKVIPHFTQTFWFKTIIVLFALGVLFLFFYLRLQNVRNKAKFNQAIKTAQLDSLRNQMNPHFIFNALNSVQSLIYSNNPDAAGDFLGKISRMFRDALEFSRTTTISLKVELYFIERYLEIEKLRFPEKLEYKITVDENLQEELENFQLPPLLMQPLVENSVKHGLKNMDGKGLVEVSVKKDGDSLVYIVEDNCGGIPEKSSSTHTSRGLSIINQRIDILNQLEENDNPYSFEFINMPGIGVRAVLRVPID